MNGPATPPGGLGHGATPSTAASSAELSTRPSTARGSARRAAVLDAAEKVLTESGYAALSLRAVADAAGIRLGNLQYYFPTRADLIGALLDRVLRRSLARLEELAAADDGDPRPSTAALIQPLLDEQTDRRLVRLFVEIWALAAADDSVARSVSAFYRDYAGVVAALIGQTRPDLSEQSRHARAEAFVALMEGASLLRSGIAGTASPELNAQVRRLALTLVNGD